MGGPSAVGGIVSLAGLAGWAVQSTKNVIDFMKACKKPPKKAGVSSSLVTSVDPVTRGDWGFLC